MDKTLVFYLKIQKNTQWGADTPSPSPSFDPMLFSANLHSDHLYAKLNSQLMSCV